MNNTDPNQTRNLSRAKNHPSFGKIMLASAVGSLITLVLIGLFKLLMLFGIIGSIRPKRPSSPTIPSLKSTSPSPSPNELPANSTS